MRGINSLVKAVALLKEPHVGKELSAIAQRVAQDVVPQLVHQFAPAANGAGAVAFLDVDDGFTCGSTGQHIIPIPIPKGQGHLQLA